MLVRAKFEENYAELYESVKFVQDSVREVKGSKALRMVLEYTLALGNYLNGTSNKGAAWGFKLETLGKLIGTKTTDNKSTLLHYMAQKLDAANKESGGSPANLLAAELKTLEFASRTVWKEQAADLSALKTSLKQVETQVKLDKVEAFTSSMGAFHKSAKVKFEELEAMHIATDEAVKELLARFGEDPKKAEPEDVIFGQLHNFVLSFEKAHRYNKELELKAKKAEAAAQAKASGATKKEAAELAKRKQRKNLVDDVESGMGKGVGGARDVLTDRRLNSFRPGKK